MGSMEATRQKDMITQISLYTYKKNFAAYIKFVTENVLDRMIDAKNKDVHRGSLEILELIEKKIKEDLKDE